VLTQSKHEHQILSWCDRGVSLKYGYVLQSINYAIRKLLNFDICSTDHNSVSAQCDCKLVGYGVKSCGYRARQLQLCFSCVSFLPPLLKLVWSKT